MCVKLHLEVIMLQLLKKVVVPRDEFLSYKAAIAFLHEVSVG